MADEITAPNGAQNPNPGPAPATPPGDPGVAPSPDVPAPAPPQFWKTEEPQPAPTPDPPKGPADDGKLTRSWEELTRKEEEVRAAQQALKQQQQSAGTMAEVQKLMSEGKHAEAFALMGGDMNQALGSYWGENFVPEPEPEDPSAQLHKGYEELKEQNKKLEAQLAQLSANSARQTLYPAVRQAIAAAEGDDLQIIQAMHQQGGQYFEDQIIESAIAEQQKTGKTKSWGEYLASAEKALFDQFLPNLKMLLQVPKMRNAIPPEIRALVAGQPAPASQPAHTPAQTPSPQPTLNNGMGGLSTPEEPVKFENLKERRDKTLAILKSMREKSA